MKTTFTAEDLLKHLQRQMDAYKKLETKYGPENPLATYRLDEMIACKEMVEALIGEPVNLQMDGKVTVGLF